MTKPLFTGINHIGILTRDLDRAVRTWSDRYGIGPWYIFRFDSSNLKRTAIQGKEIDFEMRAAHCQLSPTARVELLQPLVDDELYSASLERHGDADHIHHIRFEIDDYDEASEGMHRLGLDVELDMQTQFEPEGGIAEGVYFATGGDLGFSTEIARIPPGFTVGEPEEIYPRPPGVDDRLELK